MEGAYLHILLILELVTLLFHTWETYLNPLAHIFIILLGFQVACAKGGGFLSHFDGELAFVETLELTCATFGRSLAYFHGLLKLVHLGGDLGGQTLGL